MLLTSMSLAMAGAVKLEQSENLRTTAIWGHSDHVYAVVGREKASVLRWGPDGRRVGEVALWDARTSALPSEDAALVALWAEASDGRWHWRVLGDDLEERASGTCTRRCWPVWQPGGATLAIGMGKHLQLVDVSTGEITEVPHIAPYVPHWAGDGSHVCLPDRVLTPDGKVVAQVDYGSAHLRTDGFSLEACGPGRLMGYGIDLDTTPAQMNIRRGEAIETGIAVPVEVDAKGTRRIQEIDRSTYPPGSPNAYTDQTLRLSPERGRPQIELRDGRTVWSDEAGLWLGSD